MANPKHVPTMDELQDVLNVVSISAVMRLWGKARATVHNQIDKGRIAAKQDITGNWFCSFGSCVQLWGAPLERETYDLAGSTADFELERWTTKA